MSQEKEKTTGKVPGNFSKLREVFSPSRRPRKHQDALSGTSTAGKSIRKPGNIAHTRGGTTVRKIKEMLEHSTAQVRPPLTYTNPLTMKGHLRSSVLAKQRNEKDSGNCYHQD